MLGSGSLARLACEPNASKPAHLLLLGGVLLREPVAWYGPLVMNTEAEIHEAVEDYQKGRMGRISQ